MATEHDNETDYPPAGPMAMMVGITGLVVIVMCLIYAITQIV